MPDKDDIIIGKEFRRLSGNNNTRFPVMSGVVKAVDDDNTCSVALTCGDDSTPSTGVLLNVTLNNTAGIYGVPTVGANCLVAEIDGPGMWELIKADSYSNVYISAGTLIQFNGGGLGGLPILSKIVDNQNKILNYLTGTLQPAIANGLAAVGIGTAANGTTAQMAFNTAMAGQTISFEDMENTKIKQG
jgi:hypothetical protein